MLLYYVFKFKFSINIVCLSIQFKCSYNVKFIFLFSHITGDFTLLENLKVPYQGDELFQ